MKKAKATPLEQLNELKSFREKSMKENEIPEEETQVSTVKDKDKRFQVLISLMLSAQTKDSITEQALKNLNDGLEGGLNASSLSSSNASTVKELIKRVSFYNKKADRIIEAAKICIKDYDGDIPSKYDDLLAIKGVGKKMATLTMSEAWNKRVGIGVDTHIHRTANRLKWTKTKTPEQTEDELQSIFPEELWEEVDKSVLFFGQNICSATKPKCDQCPIYQSCPAKKNKTKKQKETTSETEDENITNEDLEDMEPVKNTTSKNSMKTRTRKSKK